MRLLVRLLLSHLAPLLVMTFAFGLPLAALYHVTETLDSLGRAELDVLRREGDLHREVWDLDLSMRHGRDDCETGRSAAQIRHRVASQVGRATSTLELTEGVTARMRQVTEDYLQLAAEVLAADVCVTLALEPLESRRDHLDEQLTNLWIARLDELHDQLTAKKEEARVFGGTAIVVGAAIALLSSLLAVFVAFRLTQIMTRPLRRLGESAQRVGCGDFQTPVHVEGPPEFVRLSEVLEQMRLQLGQLDTLKQGFLASISHELRTPLSKIREALALLQDGVVGDLSEKQREVVGIARGACEREIRLVTTLLDLSRLRAGSPVRLRDGTSIDRVIAHAAEDEGADASARSIALALSCAPNIPLCRVDAVLVERAIANLIRNAVAVSASGQTVRIACHVVARDAGQRWIRISVSDDGPGVPEAIRHAIFDAFVTRPVPASPKGVGIGLGLALAREVATAHGGDLELDLEVARGATFYLWLPLPSKEFHAAQ